MQWFNMPMSEKGLDDGPYKVYTDVYKLYNPDRTVNHFTGIKNLNGCICHFKRGLFHRIGGPAVEHAGDDYRAWFVDGRRHRLEGPAIEDGDDSEWWIAGEQFSKEQFEQLSKVFIQQQSKLNCLSCEKNKVKYITGLCEDCQQIAMKTLD